MNLKRSTLHLDCDLTLMIFQHMSSEEHLGYYTTQLNGVYNEPFQGSVLINHYK